MIIYRPMKYYDRMRWSPDPPPLTPREEALLAPQRPRQGLSTTGQGPALPPHGVDPSVRAMDESLLDVVLRRRDRANHC